MPPCLFGFIASHAVGQGSVIWVFISEIFPSRVRAAGLVLGCSTHWLCAAALTSGFPYVAQAYSPATIFGFFCAMMCFQLVWIAYAVPETRGVPLEEMEALLGSPCIAPWDHNGELYMERAAT